MSRKETPDILGALMGEVKKPESGIAVEQESKKAVNTATNKTIKPESNKAIKLVSKRIPLQSEVKEKATFNLSKDVLRDLEDCWIEIRKLRGDKRVSKTDIVEQALEDAVEEFKSKKDLSKFYGKLESNKATKQ